MKEIITTFITDYADRKTRPYAYPMTLQYVEQYREQMSEDQVKVVFDTILEFSKQYEKAWPWNRGKVMVDFIRQLN